MESIQSWISENKLASIGGLWASGMGASLVYNRARGGAPYKTSLRLIHARMHAQALTLAVLSGAAIIHYYDDHHHHNNNNIKNKNQPAALKKDTHVASLLN